MKIKAFLLSSLFLFGVPLVFAQAPLAGDTVCGGGATACTFSDLAGIFKNTALLLLQLAMAFIVIMIMWTAKDVMMSQDKAGALKQAKERMTNIVIGLLVITVVASGGYVALVSFLKVDPRILEVVKSFFSYGMDILPVTHTYAATLPNPIPGANSFLDLIALIIKLIIRFFFIPIIIFSWAYTGFQYVYAQGNPQRLVDAHKWLLWTFIGTVTIMLAEAFVAALQGTFNQIIS